MRNARCVLELEISCGHLYGKIFWDEVPVFGLGWVGVGQKKLVNACFNVPMFLCTDRQEGHGYTKLENRLQFTVVA